MAIRFQCESGGYLSTLPCPFELVPRRLVVQPIMELSRKLSEGFVLLMFMTTLQKRSAALLGKGPTVL